MTNRAAVEVEWQFDAADLNVVERWLRAQPAHAAFGLIEKDTQTQLDTYYDTTDWHVFHAGYALRVRARWDETEVTLKAVAPHGDGPVHRTEVTQSGDLAAIIEPASGPVGERLRLILRQRTLAPVVTVETHRSRWVVRSGDTDIAEIALDDTSAGAPRAELAPLRRVEVEELVPGGLASAQPLVAALQSACALTPSPQSKFEAALAIAGLHPAPPDLGPTDVTADDRAVDRAYAVLRRRFSEFLAHESGTALGEDPEELHQMRVATRRLRAALRVFDAVVPDDLLAMREELRWTGQMLGGVRDLDVQLEYLAGLRQESGWDEATAIAPLVRRFEERRTEARAALLEALDSERYANLIASLRALLLAGPPEDAPAEESVALAHRIITRRYRRFQRDARALDHHSPLEAYHALRIRGKRLRYSLELFIDLYVPEATEALRPLRRFQDQLGELQDLATMNEDLRVIVATNAAALPADTLVMIGRMMERHQLRATRIIEAYPRRAARVLAHYPRLRRAMRLLRERRTDAGVPEVNDGEDASDEAMIEPQPARPETLADRMPVPVAPTELPRSLSRRLVGAVARLFR